ncbi:XRE family transcriptional regulator [Microbacterium sp. LRZ72]|uniref:helix-turn-helix domain-containing protein n=1 Tax=Microbacterium sp. LRZ72 TaxID=2942481 RepID=UPI0029B0E50E|nr:XRE family transcriptional regulator [Microbacterium sp. LRZ72]MDX2377414.1 XRE family transcriptional regulator [Microbacterium sp. LRZ72]
MPESSPVDPGAASRSSGGGIGALLGRAIREARTEKKLSMRALAAAADISQPFLSQIESGQTMPSLITLYRVANVLGLSPSVLLPASPQPESVHVSRRDDATWVPVAEVANAAKTRVVHSGVASVQEYVVEPSDYMGDWYKSDGEVTVYVVEGEIAVEVEGRGTWELGSGDAITHPGGLRNRWAARGHGPVRIVLVYAAER